MDLEEVEKKKRTKNIILVSFLALIGVITIIIILNLFNEKVTDTTAESDKNAASSLLCTTESKDISDAFFDLSDAESASQTIKVIFKDKKLDNISYNAKIKYADDNIAKTKEASLNATYGLYVQENGKDISEYSPNFSVSGTEVMINLFATMKQLNPVFAKIFLINTEDSLSNYTSKVLYTLYNSKGFKCEIKE